MRIPPTALLEKVCSHPKAVRPLLERPYLDATDPENPVAVATNGRLMAVIPVKADATESGYLSIAALKQARKSKAKDGGVSITFGANRAHVLENGMQLPREDVEGSQFPLWRNCVPASDRPITLRLSLNPSTLLALAEAIGSGEGVTLEIHDEKSPVIVRPLAAKARESLIRGAFGVFMPARSS